MERCVLITRPDPEGARLADELERKGVRAIRSPLLLIDWLTEAALPVEGVQALLFTSANGVRGFQIAAGEQALLFDPVWRAPVLAVGDSTAKAARSAAFEHVESAKGAAAALAALAAARLNPANGPVLHCRGADVAGALAERLAEIGFEVREAVVYEARPATELSRVAANALSNGTITDVALFSPRSAAAFARLVEDIAPPVEWRIWCLSEAVAQGLGVPPAMATIEIVGAPDEESLLAALGAALGFEA